MGALFGESAGGQSIAAHIWSPGSLGLFDAAISESGGLTLIDSLESGGNNFQSLAQEVECDTAADLLTCMQGVLATRLSNAIDMLHPYPGYVGAVLDMDIYPDDPRQLSKDGKFA